MTKLTIYDIKRLTIETSPYFFSRKTMKFFNQTLKDYSVYKHTQDNIEVFLIVAPMIDFEGKQVGYTERFFNPINNTLNHVKGR